ncbi:MAG: S8 family serine peptidase [Candidatus Latescibacter sp.]|nr:S8 family serine peptidase [Candidatus Latescibacter sp.]
MKHFFSILFFSIAFIAQAEASPWWVFFTDEPGRKPGDTVSAALIERVTETGAPIRTVSRYFNAVSVEYEGSPIELEKIPGIRKVYPVRSLIRVPEPAATEKSFRAKPTGTLADSISRYGVMYDELKMLNIPAVHTRGYTGKGVEVGILDTGFDKIKETGCLKNVRIVHTRNFVRGGEDVSGDYHGSFVLACLGGMLDGEYYGPAFNASFLLAVTDDVSTETHTDEDRWVAGVEWCDSLGAKLISSSLVYNEFDNPADNYRRQDMNGHTSIVARGAEIAASRGIVMVNAAGNEGTTSWGIITTPGDAEHVIAIGAVNVVKAGDPVIAAFSSRGPTADGRIKPDVVAPGQGVYVPTLGTTGFYMMTSGTSLATPLISGLCALILETHPSWTPAQVMAALKASARDLGDPGPDNIYGWGLPDALKAIDYSPTGVAIDQSGDYGKPVSFRLMNPYPNPFNAAVVIPFSLDSPEKVRINIFDIVGRLVATVWNQPATPGRHEVLWDGEGCASGVYFVRAAAGNQVEAGRVVMVK